MKTLLFLATVVALAYLCEALKYQRLDADTLEIKPPSANPFHKASKHHLGSKHHRAGRLRGKHLSLKHLNGKNDVIKSLHDGWMKFPKGSACNKTKCGHKEFCIANPHTGDEKCISRRNFKDGRRLFRSFHKHKELLKNDKHINQLETELSSAEHMKEVYELVRDYKKANHHDHHHKLNSKHGEVKSVLEMKGIKLTEGLSNSTQECRPTELYELRKRMTGWFVLLHTESRQQHHHKFHHKDHKKLDLLKKDFGKFGHDKLTHKRVPRTLTNTIETESHGHCKCSKSIMWEFRKQDHDLDSHLSHQELIDMESNRREPCMKPLIKSCDHNSDGRMTQGEWCCCFANTIAPCAEKKRLVDPKDWVPLCDKEGYYHREQCHDDSGYCWCVDLNGNEIHGTKNLGSAHCGKYDPNGQLIKE